MAQVRTLTLREAVGLALQQNPDVVLARLEERKAEAAVRITRAPFRPRAVVGAGIAYTHGMPLSIGESAPALFQAQAVSTIFDRSLTYRVAAAREYRRSTVLETAARQEEVAYRTAEAYLDAEAAVRALEVAKRETQALESVVETVKARVEEGRELPLAARQSELALERARYRLQVLETELEYAQTTLATIVGVDAVRIVPGERPLPLIPESEEAAIESGVKANPDIRVLESRLVARGLDVRAAKAAWLPRADLVAEYALVSKINNYEDFYTRFERNNLQLGVALQMPVWPGPGPRAEADQAEAEAAQLRVRLRNARRAVEENVRKSYATLRQAEAAQRLARMDLDVAREQVSVLLAQVEEGRAPLRELEEARAAETARWIAYFDANAAFEKGRLAVLRAAGMLTKSFE